MKEETLIEAFRSQVSGKVDLVDAFLALGVKEHHIRFASDRAKAVNETLPSVLKDFGIVPPAVVARAMSLHHGVPYLGREHLDLISMSSLSKEVMEISHNNPSLVAVAQEGNRVWVLMEDLIKITEAKTVYFGMEVAAVLASEDIIQTIHRRFFAKTEQAFRELVATGNRSSSDYYSNVLDALIRHACFSGASDIHFTPLRSGGFVRLRRDGTLIPFWNASQEQYERIMGIIKTEGKNNNLTTTEEGALPPPSDIADRYGLRLQISRSVRGETAVIRILDRRGNIADFDSLGYDDFTSREVKRIARSSAGLMLITGPTGSGKSTTLYSMLKLLDPMDTSIQSVENPVEYHTGAWHQYQIRGGTGAKEGEEWGLWFKGLLRNDPDVCLLGEVRDGDTANAAIKLASTGHLVFTTLHTNSATRTITRLTEMGVNMHALADVLVGVMAQRLVRKTCIHCGLPDNDPEVIGELQQFPDLLQSATPKKASEQGCEHCDFTGYRGRTMVYELLVVDGEVARAIASGASGMQLARFIPPERTMWGMGMRLVAQGLVSYEELASSVVKE